MSEFLGIVLGGQAVEAVVGNREVGGDSVRDLLAAVGQRQAGTGLRKALRHHGAARQGQNR